VSDSSTFDINTSKLYKLSPPHSTRHPDGRRAGLGYIQYCTSTILSLCALINYINWSDTPINHVNHNRHRSPQLPRLLPPPSSPSNNPHPPKSPHNDPNNSPNPPTPPISEIPFESQTQQPVFSLFTPTLRATKEDLSLSLTSHGNKSCGRKSGFQYWNV
jgi:hypothetical protein